MMSSPTTPRGDVHIAALRRAQVAEGCSTLARAFAADPAFTSLWPDPARRARALERLMADPLAHAPPGGSCVRRSAPRRAPRW